MKALFILPILALLIGCQTPSNPSYDYSANIDLISAAPIPTNAKAGVWVKFSQGAQSLDNLLYEKSDGKWKTDGKVEFGSTKDAMSVQVIIPYNPSDIWPMASRTVSLAQNPATIIDEQVWLGGVQNVAYVENQTIPINIKPLFDVIHITLHNSDGVSNQWWESATKRLKILANSAATINLSDNSHQSSAYEKISAFMATKNSYKAIIPVQGFDAQTVVLELIIADKVIEIKFDKQVTSADLAKIEVKFYNDKIVVENVGDIGGFFEMPVF